MAQPRCPVCNCIGSAALGDYCKRHHPNANDEKQMWEDFDRGIGIETEFIPSEYGIIKDKFGYER